MRSERAHMCRFITSPSFRLGVETPLPRRGRQSGTRGRRLPPLADQDDRVASAEASIATAASGDQTARPSDRPATAGDLRRLRDPLPPGHSLVYRRLSIRAHDRVTAPRAS